MTKRRTKTKSGKSGCLLIALVIFALGGLVGNTEEKVDTTNKITSSAVQQVDEHIGGQFVEPSPTPELLPEPTANYDVTIETEEPEQTDILITDVTPEPIAELTPTPEPTPFIVEMYETKYANRTASVYRGPYDNYAILGSIAVGTAITATGRTVDKDGDTWYRIDYDGTEGYTSRYWVQDTMPTPKPTPAPKPVENYAGGGGSELVWVTATGKKYHRIPNCGKTKSAHQETLSSAQSKGLTACAKCY